MRKFFAVVLAMCLIFSMTIPAFAAEIDSNRREVLLQHEVNRIVEEIPGAVIRVQNDVIHIAVNSPNQIPNFTTQSRTTSVVSSAGGSYRSFWIPFAGEFNPYSQVFMSANVASAVAFRFDHPDLATQIIQDIVDGVSHHLIAAWVRTEEEAEDMSEEEINAIVDGLTYLVHVVVFDLEHIVFDTALNSSSTGKVEVVRGLTSNGFTQYFYYPWNNNVCATYGGYSATWFAGVYDV